MSLQEEQAFRSIKKVIEQEILLYKKYFTLLQEEKVQLKNNKPQEVSAISQKRLKLTESMLSFQESRLKIMREFTPESEKSKLREWIKVSFSSQNIKTLMPISEELFEIISTVRKSEKIHAETLNFSLKMFNGLLSIIRSASNNILKSYGRKGKIKESYNPQSRGSGVIKEV